MGQLCSNTPARADIVGMALSKGRNVGTKRISGGQESPAATESFPLTSGCRSVLVLVLVPQITPATLASCAGSGSSNLTRRC